MLNNLIRMDFSRREGRVACYNKKSLSYNHKPGLCPNIESIFTDIFFPKTKPILVSVTYWPSDKPKIIEYFDHSFKGSNTSNIQECYRIGDVNFNLLSGCKMLLEKQHYDIYR